MISLLTARGLVCATFLLLPVCAHAAPASAVTVNAATVSVTNTRDSGPGSLRSALTFATKHPNTVIGFRVPSGAMRRGVAIIQPATALPALTANGTRIDGGTQTRFGGNTNSSGPEVMLDGGRLPEDTVGLQVLAARCRVQNLIVSGFAVGILIATPRALDDRVSGCYIGTDAKGTGPRPNGYGVVIGGGVRGTLIGGLTRADRNVVSGNYAVGIKLSQCTGVKVQGCFVGLDVHGKAKLPNGVNGVQLSNGARDNLIGGTQPGARNLLSGNGQGGCVLFDDTVSGNRVQGNYVGLDVTGTQALGNGNAGIEFNACHDNFLGGLQPGAGNVVGGNPNGIRLYAAYKNSVQGNLVGLDATGQVAVPNTSNGVIVDAKAHDNVIGGVEAGARNTISGNSGVGFNLSSGAFKNRVQGNSIGTTITGEVALHNARYAVILSDGAHDNLIGGAGVGARNILAAGSPIVFLTDKGTTGNHIEGNNIGVDATGTRNLLQGWAGVQFSSEATGNTLGGATSAEGNLIAVTTEDMAQVIGNSVTGNLIQNNTPFTEAGKTAN